MSNIIPSKYVTHYFNIFLKQKLWKKVVNYKLKNNKLSK